MAGVALALVGCEGQFAAPLPGQVGGPGPGPAQGTGGAGGGGPVAEPELPPFAPAVLQGRLLLSWQYQHAVRELLGPAAAAVVTPPADSPINGLAAIGAAQLSLGATAVDLYEQSAFKAAQAALAAPAGKAALLGCTPARFDDAACLGGFLDRFGKKVFRRALSAEEKASWLAVGVAAATAYQAFDAGVEFVIAGLLQSPNFLYRFEVGQQDPADASRQKLTGEEVATRLAFFLTGTTPSEALLVAAQTGQLSTPEGVRQQAQALLESNPAGAREALTAFWREHFELERLKGLSKDSTAFPAFNAALAQSMGQESEFFLEDLVFDSDSDLRGLFDADFTYLDARLAQHYGATAPATGFQRVPVPGNQLRGGLFTQGAWLSLFGNPSNSSPTHRGKFLREKLLCQPVDAPPPTVSTTLPPPKPGVAVTLRERLQEHVGNANCSGCHALMDPLGFAFESYDGVGVFRSTEAGKPVDATGAVDGVGFTDVRGLMAALKADPRVMQCLARTVFRQATGHVETPGEARSIKAITTGFTAQGYRAKQLLIEIAASDAFRFGRLPEGVSP